MKYSKIFHMLTLAGVLSLLAVAIPATPALALGTFSIDPDEGEIDDTIEVTGRDWSLGWSYEIYFSSEEADKDDYIDDDLNVWEQVKSFTSDEEWGDFDVTFKVPDILNDQPDEDYDEDVQSGIYYVYLVDEDTYRIRDVEEFTVIAGELEGIDPEEGPVGTEVEISGTGFAEEEEITVKYDDDDVDIESGDDETDYDGEFECTIIIPESAAGDHTITIEVAGNEMEETFTVESEITSSPDSGAAGTTITVEGTGFGYKEDVTITFDGDEVATDETDKDGSFKVTFDALARGPGTYDIKAEDDDDNSDKAKFSMATTSSLNPTSGNIGTEITISGTGFKVSGTVTIKYDEVQLPAVTADSKGTFSATFKAPASKHGAHTVTISDGTITEQFTFTMESTAPPIPKPLLLQMGVKAESPVYFDWEDVTDPSGGVTYTLQVSQDKDFKTMVLEKKDLTESEYTLTEVEKLPSTKKEAPYYWRVRSKDGAENESGWTSPGTFYIGFAFEIPKWAIYLLGGLGGLLLLGLGYWLGRRSSYY